MAGAPRARPSQVLRNQKMNGQDFFPSPGPGGGGAEVVAGCVHWSNAKMGPRTLGVWELLPSTCSYDAVLTS